MQSLTSLRRFRMSAKMNVPKLRFCEFSGEWEERKLGEICLKIQDGNYGASYPKAEEFIPIGIPFLTSKAIQNSSVLMNKVDYISEKKHLNLQKAHLKLSDVVVQMLEILLLWINLLLMEILDHN